MRLPYCRSLRFPKWAKLSAGRMGIRRYVPVQDGIQAEFTGDVELPHVNHIEMSGLFCSSIISYRVDRLRHLTLYPYTVFPALRVLPNDTRGSLSTVFKNIRFTVNGMPETVEQVFFNGMLSFRSTGGGAQIVRTLHVATRRKALIEEVELFCPERCLLNVKNFQRGKTVRACFMADHREVRLLTKVFLNGREIYKGADFHLDPGKNTLVAAYGAEPLTPEEIEAEKKSREVFIAENDERLRIETPDADLNREIRFAKLRASESIFQTQNGLMHSPGGGNFYAALWTNDQCEYANPLFAYLGYEVAQRQSLNCYRLYSGLARPDRAIYSSIIAQGEDYWHGAGDRGDSSMYVYGFSRYLLTTGDCKNAQKFLSSLETACTYIMSRMNSDSVIESDSDELENRFESGKANLSTAVISYDAFISMAYLEQELNRPDQSSIYRNFAEKIRLGIQSYFEADVEGFATYRYCAEDTNLRSWICLPLTVGIDNRASGTAAALKSDKLKRPCGLLTRSGEKTFWDRSLLYAIRGLFYTGLADDALEMLMEYTNARLYGEHAPYPIEAFPEGNGAHLSAESALYVRIFTEGVLGFRPIGFHAFELKVNLPSKWDHLFVSNFVYSNTPLTIRVNTRAGNIVVTIDEIGYCQEIAPNQPVRITLPEVKNTKVTECLNS